MTLEDAYALFGEAVAILHGYRGGDPGYKNTLADSVRRAARDIALAVYWEQEAADTDLKSQGLLRRIETV